MLEPQPEGIPLPAPSALTEPFWDGCRQGRLRYQRCDRCGRAVFGPAPICPHCRTRTLSWHDSAGLGSVYSWTIAHRPMTPAFRTPYAAVIVQLDEGHHMVSNLVDTPVDGVRIGMRVQVAFHPVGAFTLPYFRPIPER